MTRTILAGLVVVAGGLFAALPAGAQSMPDGWLAPPPVLDPGTAPARPLAPLGAAPQAVSALPDVDNDDRFEVGALFQSTYDQQAAVPIGWTGSLSGCVVGTITQAQRQATIDRVNLMRVIAGLPGDIALAGGSEATDTQAAALMFSANHTLSHSPPNSWTCWTQAGYDGAHHSNIHLGYGYPLANGPAAVDGYMDDDGSGNYVVGHRRWILFPPQQSMDTGEIPWDSGAGQDEANALYVLGAFGSRPATPNGIAWPARGYMPMQLLPFRSHRWSLSIQNANFDSATVRMWKNGVALPDPTVEPTAYNGQPNGTYIGDNSIVWVADSVDYSATPGAADVTYHVEVSGISGSGVPSSVAYDVVVFDANDPIFADGFE